MEILLVPKLEWNARSATDHFPALGLLVSAFDCDVRGPVFESHHGPGCVRHDSHCDVQSLVLATHLYSSAYANSALHPSGGC